MIFSIAEAIVVIGFNQNGNHYVTLLITYLILNLNRYEDHHSCIEHYTNLCEHTHTHKINEM